MNIIVIGGGAAGLMAAGTAAENGAQVTLLETNEKVGRKLFITGKGRCNVCNNCDTQGVLQEMIGSWKLFDSLDTIEQEFAEVQAKRNAALEQERDALQAELPNLKGLFSGGKRRELEAKIAEIEEELKKL